MHLRLLGGVELRTGIKWTRAGPVKQATVLAILAMEPNRSVTQRTLIHRVWGFSPPTAVKNVVYSHMTRLRRLVDSVPGMRLVRGTSHGYKLETIPELIDLFAMRKLATEASQARTAGNHREAAVAWRAAAELTSPEPLDNLDGIWAERTRASLQQECLSVTYNLFKTELALGNHELVLDELVHEVATHPHEEPLIGQLMHALYLNGKQADALACFQEAATRLRNDLGIEPGSELSRMHRRILQQDAGLQPWEPKRSAPAPRGIKSTFNPRAIVRPRPRQSVPRQLPSLPHGIIGCDLIKRLDKMHADGNGAPILITGMAGVGKTCLAVRWAHRVAHKFPDGQLFCDLRGFSVDPPRCSHEALASFLRGLGVPNRCVPDDPEERTALYRTRTADSRVLVVLDNAFGADQVRALTPTGRGSLVLVTSRVPLSGLVAMQGAVRLEVPRLSPDNCRRLLATILNDNRVEDEAAATCRLIRLCDGLPLALRIAATRLADRPMLSIADLVDELTDAGGLRALTIAGDSDAGVRTAFDRSYQRLRPATKRTFDALGRLPEPTFTAADVAARLSEPLDQVREALEMLVAVGLIAMTKKGLFKVENLLWAYAREHSACP